MDPGVIQLVSIAGAAGALLYVLKLITDGKLHTSSEVDGLKQDKADLLKITRAYGEALRVSNEIDRQILGLLQARVDDKA